MGTARDPRWWSEEHRSAWERVKAAFRRDWEQTKADVSSKGRDLNQDVDDTVKQALGKEPIPPMSQPTKPDEDWDKVEDELRYGYGAHQQYRVEHRDWNDRLEAKLKEEWNDLHSGRTWDEAKSSVRRGWERATSETMKGPH